MEHKFTSIIKKFHLSLSIYRNYYGYINANEELNNFYLNACFVHTIGDFEKELASLLNIIFKLDDTYKVRHDQLCEKFGVKGNYNINSLILASRKRIIPLVHLILNKNFDINIISLKRSKFGNEIIFPEGITDTSYSTLGKKIKDINPGNKYLSLNYFFDEAIERRNAIIHRSAVADSQYIKKTKLNVKNDYKDISLHDTCKKYLIENKFYESYLDMHTLSYPKEEYKENLMGTSLTVHPHYFSHVIMKIQLFLYYFIELSLREANESDVDEYLVDVLSYCIGFCHNIPEANDKYIFENCKLLIDYFVDSRDLKLVNNEYLFSYALYVMDKYDKYDEGIYKRFINTHNPLILKNNFAKFYNCLQHGDYIEMSKIFKKMCTDKIIKSKNDIVKNFIFIRALSVPEFRESCRKELNCSIKKEDFVNKFSVESK